jgi:hypothetical protein
MLQINKVSATAFIFIDLQPIFTDGVSDVSFEKAIVEGLEYARSVFPASHIIHLRADYKDSISKPTSRIMNPLREQPWYNKCICQLAY